VDGSLHKAMIESDQHNKFNSVTDQRQGYTSYRVDMYIYSREYDNVWCDTNIQVHKKYVNLLTHLVTSGWSVCKVANYLLVHTMLIPQ